MNADEKNALRIDLRHLRTAYLLANARNVSYLEPDRDEILALALSCLIVSHPHRTEPGHLLPLIQPSTLHIISYLS